MNVCVTKNHVWKSPKSFLDENKKVTNSLFFLDICKSVILLLSSVQFRACWQYFLPLFQHKVYKYNSLCNCKWIEGWQLDLTMYLYCGKDNVTFIFSTISMHKKNNAYREITHSHFNGPTASLQAIDLTNTVELNVLLCYVKNQLLLHTRQH